MKPDVAAPLDAFPRDRRWLLPVLHAAQGAAGYLSGDALAAVAAHLRVPLSEVHGVATHYPELRLVPRGRHHVRVCTGVSCAILGGRALLDAAARALGAAPGVFGAERDVTLEAADCFFACSIAPAVEVDGRLHGRVRHQDVATLHRRFAFASPDHRATGHAAEVTTPRGTPAAGSATAALAALRSAAEARRRRRPAVRLLVGAGTDAAAVGATALVRALAEAIARRGAAVELVEAGCDGACWAAPSVRITRPDRPAVLLERVDPALGDAVVAAAIADAADFAAAGLRGVVFDATPFGGLVPAAEHPFWRGQERVLLARCGAVDPASFDDAVLDGAYAALARARDGAPEDVIEAVKASGLQGRGGAFFPTAVKWEACRRAAGAPKYVVMNGEEGEPGIFKDRHLMEGDPHRVLEGVLLAAWAAGVTRAILYIHGEADLSAARMAAAVAAAREAGLTGDVEIEVRRGAGGFVLGEETALLESIEGRRAQPRTRPPFPVESGLWGRPTVINNVETLAAIPTIVARGGEWFAALGTPNAPGTKVFGLSGALARPGVVETRNGVTLGDLLGDIGGADVRALLGAVVGGPSGSIVPAALFDVPMEPRGRVSTGTGGVIALRADVSVRDVVRTLLGFNANESCGKCTPCREGLPRLLAMLDDVNDEAPVRELAEAIQLASLCGLGQSAPLALTRALETFPDAMRSTS